MTRAQQRKLYIDFAQKFRAGYKTDELFSTTYKTALGVAWDRHYNELQRTQVIQDLVSACTF